MFRLLITGSRTWGNKETVRTALEAIRTAHAEVTLVSGHAWGADRIAESIAKEFGWTIEIHEPDWDGLGKSAGYKRNEHMVNLGADECLAFIRQASVGATHCAGYAELKKIPVTRFIA